MLLLLLPLVVTTIWLSYSSVYGKYHLKKQMWAVEQQVQLAQAVGGLINEMQKERGLTSGFLVSKGKEFSADLEEQKKRTDLARQKLALLDYNEQRSQQLKTVREDV
ncbi:MAG: nitrate- and nitrite sensing domain-containing protein, partial [Pantoea sp.]|nr:nitrate- and nitrite sensing domain-containing protein [Pantoea sp.]